MPPRNATAAVIGAGDFIGSAIARRLRSDEDQARLEAKQGKLVTRTPLVPRVKDG